MKAFSEKISKRRNIFFPILLLVVEEELWSRILMLESQAENIEETYKQTNKQTNI